MAVTVPQNLSASVFISKKIILRFSDTIFIGINLLPSLWFFGNSPSDDITDQFNYDLLSIWDFIFVFFAAAVSKTRAREGRVPTRYDRRRWNYGCFMFPSKAGGEGRVAGSGKGWNRNWSLTFVEYILKRHIVRNSNTSHENGSRRKTKRNLNWRLGVSWAGGLGGGGNIKIVQRFFHWNVNIKSKMCENE